MDTTYLSIAQRLIKYSTIEKYISIMNAEGTTHLLYKLFRQIISAFLLQTQSARDSETTLLHILGTIASEILHQAIIDSLYAPMPFTIDSSEKSDILKPKSNSKIIQQYTT